MTISAVGTNFILNIEPQLDSDRNTYITPQVEFYFADYAALAPPIPTSVQSLAFTVDVKSCLDAVLTPFHYLSTYVYNTYDPPFRVGFLQVGHIWNYNYPLSCGTIDVNFLQSTDSGATFVPVDPDKFDWKIDELNLWVETHKLSDVGFYTMSYKAYLVNYPTVESAMANEWAIEIKDGCSVDGSLEMSVASLSNPPEYLYTGALITENLSQVFSTNKMTWCPIKSYECEFETAPGSWAPCEQILTGSDTAVTFDRTSGAFTFMAEWTSIPANLPDDYAIRFKAFAGTTDDVFKDMTYTVTLRCMISPDEFVWNVPLMEEYELIRKDYLAGWVFPAYNLDPIAVSNNPVYHLTDLCPCELPIKWLMSHKIKDTDLVQQSLSDTDSVV